MLESLVHGTAGNFEALRGRALGLARRHARDSTEAEDIVQEALTRAWRHRHRLRDRDKVWPWLAMIVVNEAKRASARQRPEAAGDDYRDQGAEDENLANMALRVDLNRALAGLAESDRMLLRLRYELDLTQAAIALRLGWPEGTVKVRLHRARNRLKVTLRDGVDDSAPAPTALASDHRHPDPVDGSRAST